MPTSGNIEYSEARAVQIRTPEDIKAIHSAISSTVNIKVDSVEERKLILDLWPTLMEELAEKVSLHIAGMNGE